MSCYLPLFAQCTYTNTHEFLNLSTVLHQQTISRKQFHLRRIIMFNSSPPPLLLIAEHLARLSPLQHKGTPLLEKGA
jgi:hypothetical protein